MSLRTTVLLAALAGIAGCGSAVPGGGVAVTDGDAGAGAEGGSVSADVPAAGCRYPGTTTRPDGRTVGGPFVTRVVSFTPGDAAGFGQDRMPDVVMGPPVGGGDFRGGTDVVSLGRFGEIVVALDDMAITDGEGTDFIVFENPFEVQGRTPLTYFEELGEVSVSDDGTTWHTFPCDAHGARPHTGCAGWNPVYSAPGNTLCATDPSVAGGDPFDLHDVGLQRARYVRIRDLGTQSPIPPTAGFDLDAVAVIHGASTR